MDWSFQTAQSLLPRIAFTSDVMNGSTQALAGPANM